MAADTVAVRAQENDGPDVWLTDTKLVPAGRGSDRLTEVVADGPVLATVTV